MGIYEKIKPGNLLLLSKNDVNNLMPNNLELIDLMNEVFEIIGQGKTLMPSKSILSLPDNYNGRMVALPSFINKKYPLAGLKWAASYSTNPKSKLPSVNALILMNNPNNGIPFAILDGTSITAKRTGAATVAGLINIIGKDINISSLSIIGTSTQAYQQAYMIKEIYDYDNLYIFDIDENKMLNFKKEMEENIDAKVKITKNAEEACYNSDIIVTATRCNEPFLKGEWCLNSKAVVSIGGNPELEISAIELAENIIVDNLDAVRHLGSLEPYFSNKKIDGSHIFAEISEIASGNKKLDNKGGYNLFIPIGMGVEDLIVAEKIIKNALNQNFGEVIKNFIN